ncbi:hypothetical protein [Pseudactinotalea suaedae]|uniref:hypothetical protein n=1 Tax=Pseudactinotalea suaedae TaxID=1524924 RepID=UPI0012E2FFA8|nr:hypothetical protein [Pseudactinotalea suaedae]
MDVGFTPLALVVLVGPQASGKSALASSLAAHLRGQGERVAVVELDQVAAMALPTLPSWETAHRIFETVTGMWARADLTCVIAEGSGEPDEVSGLLRQTPPDAVAITVATTAPFEVALARAQADPTRGRSKDRDFLSRIYDAWPDKMAAIDPSLVIDTSAHTLAECVERVRSAVDRARMA